MSTGKKIWLLILVFVGLFAYGVYNIFQPDKFPLKFVRGEVREITPDIIIGPYPTESELLKLRRIGVREVISLLDPDSPVESRIVDEEKRLMSIYDLEYSNFPMTFMSLESEANLKQIALLVDHLLSSGGKKIYIHCYLGRHRVSILERELLKIKNPGGKTAP